MLRIRPKMFLRAVGENAPGFFFCPMQKIKLHLVDDEHCNNEDFFENINYSNNVNINSKKPSSQLGGKTWAPLI